MGPTLTGELTFATARAALTRARAAVSSGSGPLELDLAEVTRVDSAGVALLLEVARLARARQRELRVRNAPQQLRRLVEFFGVAELLQLAA